MTSTSKVKLFHSLLIYVFMIPSFGDPRNGYGGAASSKGVPGEKRRLESIWGKTLDLRVPAFYDSDKNAHSHCKGAGTMEGRTAEAVLAAFLQLRATQQAEVMAYLTSLGSSDRPAAASPA